MDELSGFDQWINGANTLILIGDFPELLHDWPAVQRGHGIGHDGRALCSPDEKFVRFGEEKKSHSGP